MITYLVDACKRLSVYRKGGQPLLPIFLHSAPAPALLSVTPQNKKAADLATFLNYPTLS